MPWFYVQLRFWCIWKKIWVSLHRVCLTKPLLWMNWKRCTNRYSMSNPETLVMYILAFSFLIVWLAKKKKALVSVISVVYINLVFDSRPWLRGDLVGSTNTIWHLRMCPPFTNYISVNFSTWICWFREPCFFSHHQTFLLLRFRVIGAVLLLRILIWKLPYIIGQDLLSQNGKLRQE